MGPDYRRVACQHTVLTDGLQRRGVFTAIASVLPVQMPARDLTDRKATFPRLGRHPRAQVPEKVGCGSLAILHLLNALIVVDDSANFERCPRLYVGVFSRKVS